MSDTKQTMGQLRDECKALNLEIPSNPTRAQLEKLISDDVARTAAELNVLIPGIVGQPESDEEPDGETVDEAAARHDDERFGDQDQDEDQDEPEDEDEPEPVTSLGRRMVPMFYPSVHLGSVTESCSHVAWGHQSEGAAKKCLASLLTAAREQQ